jgi:hypothetical protein
MILVDLASRVLFRSHQISGDERIFPSKSLSELRMGEKIVCLDTDLVSVGDS